MGRPEDKAATRAALIEAGLAEFVEHGLDAPSLDAICARAGYTRGAFYVHFGDREDFLSACMEQVIGAWLVIIATTADPAHDLERTVRAFAQAFAALTTDATVEDGRSGSLVHSAARFHLVVAACHRSPQTRRRFADTVGIGLARIAAVARAGQDAGSVRSDVDADAAAVLLAALVFGLLSLVEGGVPIDAHALADALLRIIGEEAYRERLNPAARASSSEQK